MGHPCECTLIIDNQLDFDLTLSDATLSYGNWKSYPETTVSKNTKETIGSSWSKECSTYGTTGTVVYGIPDGTTFIIHFDVPYGTTSPTCRSTASGARASQYEVKCSIGSGYTPKATTTISRSTETSE